MPNTNRIARIVKAVTPQISEEQLLTIAKAIHDAVLEQLNPQFETGYKNLQDRNKEEVSGLVARLVSKEFSLLGPQLKQQTDDAKAEIKKQVEGLHELFDGVRNSLNQKTDSLDKRVAEFSEHMNSSVRENLLSLIKDLPIPRVVVPAEAIRVDVQQAVFSPNISLPEMAPIFSPNIQMPEGTAPIVNVASPNVEVNIPKQEPSIVNVSVPEMKAPDVIVNVPKRSLVRKSFTYSEDGRPLEVIEKEE